AETSRLVRTVLRFRARTDARTAVELFFADTLALRRARRWVGVEVVPVVPRHRVAAPRINSSIANSREAFPMGSSKSPGTAARPPKHHATVTAKTPTMIGEFLA